VASAVTPKIRRKIIMAELSDLFRFRLGYAVDPAIAQLIPKEDLLAIRAREIDATIKEMQGVIENLQFVKTTIQKQIGSGKK
jgi:hypothetical protein